ncbi:MAG: prepilin peptidase [Planctomycetota bacterium]|jgi:leader peptidase (prepilin peptidase)/N-methyltransferase
MSVTFWTVTAGVFGLLVGSFLNVCIFRIPRNCMSVTKSRSRCPKCQALIRWFDNLPLVSWIALGAKCRRCGAPIPLRYPAVELMTGLFFAYAAWRCMTMEPSMSWVLQAAFFAVHVFVLGAMIASTFIDLDFQILPDEITISGVIIGLVVSAGIPEWHDRMGSGLATDLIGNAHLRGLVSGALGALVGGGVIYVVGVVGKLAFRKEAMGGGDVKYMAFLGAFLGWKAVLFAFLIACLYGSVFGIAKLVAVRRMGYVPFGPFLSMGVATMLFFSTFVFSLWQEYLKIFQNRPPA